MTTKPMDEARTLFAERFGASPEVIAFAPGRVEVLGNHTDYNGGFVMPLGLDRGIAIAAGRGDGLRVEIHTTLGGARAEFALDRIERDPACRWADYPKGVLDQLARAGVPLGGMRLLVASDLPTGAGVSSSAALELATAEAAYGLFGGRPEDRMQEALLCQRAEVEFVGVPCGLLDQFSSTFARAGAALFLDCATREWARLPLGSAAAIVLAESGVRHALVDGKYAELRRSCERAARRIGDLLGRPVRLLRDVTALDLERVGGGLPADDLRRARHVVEENARVLRGRRALEEGRPEALGPLMLDSHASSRDLLGNSCPELDLLVEEARRLPGFLGGKLSGGGFGGATVNLVEPARAAEFAEALAARYRERAGRPARMVLAGIGDGARVEPAGLAQ